MKKVVFLFLFVGIIMSMSAQTKVEGFDERATIVFKQVRDTENKVTFYKITQVLVEQPSAVFADLCLSSVMGFTNQDTLPGSQEKFYNFTIVNASTNEILYGGKALGAGSVEMRGKSCFIAYNVGLTKDKSKVEIIFDDEARRFGDKPKSYIKDVRDPDLLPAPAITPPVTPPPSFWEKHKIEVILFIIIAALAVILMLMKKKRTASGGGTPNP
jgi:hypothetical protein